MKKLSLVSLLLSAAVVFGCTPDDPATGDNPSTGDDQKPEEVEFTLSDSNIEISGLDYDFILDVDNTTRAVDIYADYLDKVNTKALTVSFKGLAEGVTVEYSETYDYSTRPQTVNFKKADKYFPYVFTVVLGKPSPKFLDLSVGGVDVAGETVKLSGSTDLKECEVLFVVSPEDTEVLVAGEVIESGALVDFSDKVNGVQFVLRCGEVEVNKTVKAVTTGINAVTRVWGHYVKPTTVTDDWFGTKVAGNLDALRNVAMNDEYVFLSKDKITNEDKTEDGCGVYAVKIDDPDNVVLLSRNGIAEGERFFSIAVLGDKVLAASFVMAKDAHYRLYCWDSVSADPAVVLDYTLPEAMRLGDKLAVEGDWTSGIVWAYDNTSGTKMLAFEVKDGKISATPKVVDLDYKMGSYGTFYKYQEGEYVWAGNSASTLFSVSGTTATRRFEFPSSSFPVPGHGLHFFSFNEENYMGYTALQNNFQDGQYRITPLNAETLEDCVNNPANPYVFWLGDPEEKEAGTRNKNGNGLGSAAYRVVGGRHLVAAYVPGTGLSLFEIK